MKTIYKGGYCYPAEAYCLLRMIADGENPAKGEKMKDVFAPGEWEKMLWPPTCLYEAVSEITDKDEEKFKILFSSDKDMHIPAEIYFFEILEAEINADSKPGQKVDRLKRFAEFFDVPEFSDDKEFCNFVFSQSISDELKYRILYVFHYYEELAVYTAELVKRTAITVEEVINRISPIDFDRDAIANLTEGDFASNLKELTQIDIKEGGNFYVYPFIAGYNALTVYGSIDSGNYFIMVGLHLPILIKHTRQDYGQERMLGFLKAVSDKTKYEIVKMLTHEAMYGAQIAEKLSLTTATISHHVGSLASLGLVELKKENNRIYYSLNKEAFARYADELRRLID